MLSNRMTAKRRDAKPAIQHISKTEKIISELNPTKLCFFTFFTFPDVSLMFLSYAIAAPFDLNINAPLLSLIKRSSLRFRFVVSIFFIITENDVAFAGDEEELSNTPRKQLVLKRRREEKRFS